MKYTDTFVQPHSGAKRAARQRESRGPHYRGGSDMGLLQGAKRMDDEADAARKMLREAGYGTDNTGVGDPD